MMGGYTLGVEGVQVYQQSEETDAGQEEQVQREAERVGGRKRRTESRRAERTNSDRTSKGRGDMD